MNRKARHLALTFVTIVLAAAAFDASRRLVEKRTDASSRGVSPPATVHVVALSAEDESTHREGETVLRQFEVRNRSSIPVTVESLEPSCSCLAWTLDESSALPRRIEPGGVLPFAVQASVRAAGPVLQSFHVGVRLEAGGTRWVEHAELSLRAAQELRPSPSELQMTAGAGREDATGTVFLVAGDSREAEGELRARASDPARFDVRIRRFDASTEVDGKLAARAAVDVMALGLSAGEEATCTVEVTRDGEALFSIPVRASRRRALVATPSRVSFDAEGGRATARKVLLEADGGPLASLRVASCPDWLRVKWAAASESSVVLELERTAPAVGDGPEELVLEVGTERVSIFLETPEEPTS
ncbi:MAG: hypothetical protein KatS3mg108_1503 [Isosphaeraceae bacterium]|jgi:hypothetical protein|nr:MAG: hypothetical protein KatS3mg108_1503 [Isosphaeraceae bacterium]